MIKRIILLVAFMTLCVCSAFAQYALCGRVGPVIDSAERAYFGLFPNVKGFVSATASQQADGRVAFTIKRTDSTVPPDTTFTMDAAVADYLATFIEDFESFRHKPNKINWQMLDGLIDYDHVYDNGIEAGVEAILERRDGEKLYGRVLFVDDSSLVFWESLSEFSYRDMQTSARRLRLSEIQKFIIEREDGFGTGFGYGALIGGVGAGLFFLNNIRGFRGYTDIVVLATLGVALGVGLIGGAIQAIGGIDTIIDDVWMVNEFRTPSDRLKRHAVFTSLPPPELLRFVHP